MRGLNAKNQWQLTIYVPKEMRGEKILERLKKLGEKQRRSMNFLALEALLKYLREAENQFSSWLTCPLANL